MAVRVASGGSLEARDQLIRDGRLWRWPDPEPTGRTTPRLGLARATKCTDAIFPRGAAAAARGVRVLDFPKSFFPHRFMEQLRHSGDLEACHDAYRALLEACRPPFADRSWREPDRGELAARVCEFARCARQARVRPELVLSALREALSPLAARDDTESPVDTRALILGGIDHYYASRVTAESAYDEYQPVRDAQGWSAR